VRVPVPRLVVAVLLVVGAVVWLRINKPVEGPTLFELTHNHGVTVADLLSVGMVLLAVVVACPTRDD
jgi:hypothetical protein